MYDLSISQVQKNVKTLVDICLWFPTFIMEVGIKWEGVLGGRNSHNLLCGGIGTNLDLERYVEYE